jgi:Spy/CpxP family protein refolding chaperone
MKTVTTTLMITGLALGGMALALADDGFRGHGEHHGAQCKDGHWGKGMEGGMEHMMEGLDLTPDQRSQVRAIVDQARPSMRELRDKMRDNRKQLRQLTQAATVDEKAVRSLADAQGKLKADMIMQRSKMQVALNKVLTPAQRKQWQDMRPGGGWGHDHGHHHGDERML